MKRDVDLIRQLLIEVERQGPECPFDALRSGAPQETDDRTRYHVRLLIDAGFVKEIDRTSAGFPCVRLTNAGHEFLDLCRGEPRWREAKCIVQEQTGGLSLSVLRAVLTKWAVDGISRSERHRRWRRTYLPYYYRVEPTYRGETAYRVDSYRYEREPTFEDEGIRLVRPRPEYREPREPIERWDYDPVGAPDASNEGPLGVTLPVHMI
jgi:hypothetical protein